MSAAPELPFVTDVRATAFIAAGIEHGVCVTYYDQDGAPLASSFAALADVEQHAHDLLDLVAAARHPDADARLGKAPKIKSALMRDLVLGPMQHAAAIVHETPPCELTGFRQHRLARFLSHLEGTAL